VNFTTHFLFQAAAIEYGLFIHVIHARIMFSNVWNTTIRAAKKESFAWRFVQMFAALYLLF
jgi:hypothetical protein